jgi:hypothetical protein
LRSDCAAFRFKSHRDAEFGRKIRNWGYFGDLNNHLNGSAIRNYYTRLRAMAEHRDLPPETLLRRSDVAAALTEAGFPIAPATLATKAVRGGGPPFRYFGRIPLYPWGTTLEWARGRLSRAVSNTSEASAA